jgi:hypothetical protein
MWYYENTGKTLGRCGKLFRMMEHRIGMMAKEPTTRNRNGTGRLVPTRPTGVEYRVKYGIHIVDTGNQHGRGVRPTRWAKCSVRPAGTGRIPQGDYFLHADEGGVFQLKCTGSVWQYLAAA